MKKESEQISKQADEYAKQFDSDNEMIAEHYYQGAMAEREKFQAMIDKWKRQLRGYPGYPSIKTLSEDELIGGATSNGFKG